MKNRRIVLLFCTALLTAGPVSKTTCRQKPKNNKKFEEALKRNVSSEALKCNQKKSIIRKIKSMFRLKILQSGKIYWSHNPDGNRKDITQQSIRTNSTYKKETPFKKMNSTQVSASDTNKIQQEHNEKKNHPYCPPTQTEQSIAEQIVRQIVDPCNISELSHPRNADLKKYVVKYLTSFGIYNYFCRRR